jgi:ATP-dependent helicase/nuclease subunit A
MRHEIIAASAGSGKTYQLVRRCAHLLALGARPDSIAAMTFTRKAAAEFFQRILRQIALLAATGGRGAAEYFAGLEPAPPATVNYTHLLRRVTSSLHRLRLGTLDSFFASVAGCHALELGLPAVFVLDELEAERQRDAALEALLDEMQRSGDTVATGQLLEEIKQAGFGREGKSFEKKLRSWAANALALYLDTEGGAAAWGNMDLIWPDRSVVADKAELARMAAELRNSFENLTAGQSKFFDELAEQLARLEPGAPVEGRLEYFCGATSKAWADLERGSAELTWSRKKLQLSPVQCGDWLALAAAIARSDFAVRAKRTAGLARFVEQFDKFYGDRVRGGGALTFADVPRLLAELDAWSEIWFRLDQRTFHWLFDEFQDTSRLQWQVVEPLVEEVLQDDSGERSFFAVGDVKQSIYGFRQAEPALFGEVKRLPANGGIHLRSLSESRRSAQQVLDAVNQVFGDAGAIESMLPGSAENWSFEEHRSAYPEMSGYAALVTHPPDEKVGRSEDGEDDGDGDLSNAHRAAARLILDVDPLNRGLTCAVLTRSNNAAQAMTEALRRLTGMPVVCESENHPFTDNGVCLTLLSLFQLVAHPRDKFALEHLRMTPLGEMLEGSETGGLRTVAGLVARQIHDLGFGPVVAEWSRYLRGAWPEIDDFSRLRLEQFARFAVEYDASGGRDVGEFIAAARDHTVRQPSGAAAQSVQVMTVHKSKGLEFDMVIVVDQAKRGMNSLNESDEFLCHRDGAAVRWVIQRPLKALRSVDPVLRDLDDERAAATGFDSLCNLYVAMTRAKRALFLLAKPAPRNGTAVTPAAFLRARLDADAGNAETEEDFWVEWEHGDPLWYEQAGVQEAAAAVPPPVGVEDLSVKLRAVQPASRRRTPSGEETTRLTGKMLFSPEGETGRLLGTLVHELLSRIDWLEGPVDANGLIASWRQRGWLPEDETGESAASLLAGMLASPAAEEVFARPVTPVELWREKTFDAIVDGDWVSGVIDRARIELDPATGRPVGAWIVDFKTDITGPDHSGLDPKIAGYAPQMELYREAAVKLTGLAPEEIRVSLFFVREGLLRDVVDVA